MAIFSSLESLLKSPSEALQSTKTSDMGRAYRTPSPQRDVYVSSSTEATPRSAPAASFLRNTLTSRMKEEPSTPGQKRTIVHWHGLPSPETPQFGDLLYSASDGRNDGNIGVTVPGSDDKSRALQLSPIETSRDLCESVDRTQESLKKAQFTDEEAGFEENNVSAPSPGTAVESPSNVVQRDEVLARELEASTGAAVVRRSSRISAKVTDKDTFQPPAAPARTIPKSRGITRKPEGTTIAHSAEANDYAIVPFKADPVSFEGLPALHSLEWQLQYPPGGSTHPCYPFPTPDPRLLFHENLVHIVDGLPDLSATPKLTLPMGWRHVSWFGLLPIVFDPYQQAFKLTPVGPLPLTCEELHQNGLHKYVPGGELHPETALLPAMINLSDGSDSDVYDWPGASWELPWSGQTHFDSPLTLQSTCATGQDSGFVPHMFTQNFLLAMNTEPLPWREARDCPNQIFDLEDGWRWLAGKEHNPTADFVPSLTKQWRGSGAFRSTRVFKSPIPELMMLAKFGDPDDITYLLQNQDAREPRKYNHFCPFKSVATPVYVDITLLADTEITVMELLCYFPLHFNWGAAAERYARAGIFPSTIRDAINMTRALTGDTSPACLTQSAISGATGNAKKRDIARREESQETTDTRTSYTAEGWHYDVWEKINYPVLALAHGLQELPQGADAGPLTALIQYCRLNARYEILLGDVPMLLKEVGIVPLIEPGETGCPDQEVLPRHIEALKKDRRRFKESLRNSKRHAEDDCTIGTIGKKRRVE